MKEETRLTHTVHEKDELSVVLQGSITRSVCLIKWPVKTAAMPDTLVAPQHTVPLSVLAFTQMPVSSSMCSKCVTELFSCSL